VTARAIRGENFNAVHNFPSDIQALQKFFSADNYNSKIRAIPGEGLDIPIWILGSSTDSARVAAAMGLPYAFASHFAPAYFLEAIELYRKNFRPSKYLDKPYVMACVNVVAADTDAEAEWLSTSILQFFLGVVSGQRKLLQPPVENMDEIWGIQEEHAVGQMLAYSFIGGAQKLKQRIKVFLQQTQVDEIMATSHIFDHNARIKSYQLFSEVVQEISSVEV